eukprot:421464-Pyramimonas_sp.AAC.1
MSTTAPWTRHLGFRHHSITGEMGRSSAREKWCAPSTTGRYRGWVRSEKLPYARGRGTCARAQIA